MPPFPLETLPPNVRAFVESSAASARARRELIAAPFLALVGGAIGNQASIEVGQGWIERPVLRVSLVAPTGAGKSPALAAARLPFDRLHERPRRIVRISSAPIGPVVRVSSAPDSMLTPPPCTLPSSPPTPPWKPSSRPSARPPASPSSVTNSSASSAP
ncbi:MAG: DUF3987 domain-containing protein [Thermomicrobiales bacterium]